jgi:predicted CXXCH cytochrome family protein
VTRGRIQSGLVILILLVAVGGWGQTAPQNTDVLGAHDFSSGSSPMHGQQSNACSYCHVPHRSINNTPLWNQQLSTSPYEMYSSHTTTNTTVQPTLGRSSVLCLSCHDGTVGVGQTYAYGKMTMTGAMTTAIGTKLEGSHPFSLQTPLKDAPSLVSSLAATGTTADTTKAVKLINGSVECTSCHDPHNQRIDKLNPNFLVRDSIRGGLCLSCHESQPRTVNSHGNPLEQWPASVHANSGSLVAQAAGLGGYSTVAEFACSSCHAAHNAGGAMGLLRNPNPPVPNVDTTSQSCVVCHDGASNVSPPAPNIFSELTKSSGHPYATAANPHNLDEPAVLNQNRHATCADCHNAHASQPVTNFGLPPGMRGSQNLAVGVDAKDGTTVLTPAMNQYETCLRCHGTSVGKGASTTLGYLPLWAASAPDRLNLIPQFNTPGTSSHPVMSDRHSGYPQPSLRTYMLQVDGTSQGRPMGARILCTDCHNADDNREFGGAGPNGPHGSKWMHILERRYEFSQATAPGQQITNLFPNPDQSVNGPYALCAKCHDLNQLLADTSFTQHSKHINMGVSCSVCHTGHGIGAQTANLTGERLVNFDVNVVAQNGTNPISYNHATQSCTLTCHAKSHGN